MLYHLSLYPIPDGLFKPRIPAIRVDGEDSSIPRICFSKSIIGCLQAMPTNKYILANLQMLQDDFYMPAVMYLYRIDEKSIPKRNKYSSKYLTEKGYVPDAQLNHEVWVINQNVIANCIAIRIVDCKLQSKTFYKYKAKMNVVKTFQYESSIEKFERNYKYLVCNCQSRAVINRLATSLGIKTSMNIKLNSKGNKLYYINMIVPTNVDMLTVWAKINHLEWNSFFKSYKKFSIRDNPDFKIKNYKNFIIDFMGTHFCCDENNNKQE